MFMKNYTISYLYRNYNINCTHIKSYNIQSYNDQSGNYKDTEKTMHRYEKDVLESKA